MNTPALIVCVYAALVIVGGIFGFVKAASRPSLIGGVAGGLALLAAAYGMSRHQGWGSPLAFVLIFALLIFFGVRYFRSSPRAFMPGGLMSILSLFALIGVWLAHAR